MTTTFNEITLRDEICKAWGAHGAHAEVYAALLNVLAAARGMAKQNREHLNPAEFTAAEAALEKAVSGV